MESLGALDQMTGPAFCRCSAEPFHRLGEDMTWDMPQRRCSRDLCGHRAQE